MDHAEQCGGCLAAIGIIRPDVALAMGCLDIVVERDDEDLVGDAFVDFLDDARVVEWVDDQSVDALLRSLRPAQTGPEGEEAALSDPEAPAPAPERPEKPTLSTSPDSEATRRQSYLRFSREFPQVKAEEIPPEIWRDFAAGKGDLAYLYARHENRQLRSALTAARQNEENRRKSTGSRATAGSAMSKLDADWYDGT